MLNFNRQFFFWVARNLIIFYSPFLGNDETRRKEVETSWLSRLESLTRSRYENMAAVLAQNMMYNQFQRGGRAT